jgi:hypothetical protein
MSQLSYCGKLRHVLQSGGEAKALCRRHSATFLQELGRIEGPKQVPFRNGHGQPTTRITGAKERQNRRGNYGAGPRTTLEIAVPGSE